MKTQLLTDEDFTAFVQRHRDLGYGRMMQIISELWRAQDPIGALAVGDTHRSLERKHARCSAEGHDRHSGPSYDWCDRCGECLDLDVKETP